MIRPFSLFSFKLSNHVDSICFYIKQILSLFFFRKPFKYFSMSYQSLLISQCTSTLSVI